MGASTNRHNIPSVHAMHTKIVLHTTHCMLGAIMEVALRQGVGLAANLHLRVRAWLHLKSVAVVLERKCLFRSPPRFKDDNCLCDWANLARREVNGTLLHTVRAKLICTTDARRPCQLTVRVPLTLGLLAAHHQAAMQWLRGPEVASAQPTANGFLDEIHLGHRNRANIHQEAPLDNFRTSRCGQTAVICPVVSHVRPFHHG
mmetsp:Transcript_23224/g.54037  ORF Transcript_23224/g.54037 Transcript_23224/m.54037 type:complete len:202 (-) Transcript_23224:440-1045(-)